MLVYGQNGHIFPDFPQVAEVVHARALVACLSSSSDNVCRQYHLRPQPAQSSCLTRDNLALGSSTIRVPQFCSGQYRVPQYRQYHFSLPSHCARHVTALHSVVVVLGFLNLVINTAGMNTLVDNA